MKELSTRSRGPVAIATIVLGLAAASAPSMAAPPKATPPAAAPAPTSPPAPAPPGAAPPVDATRPGVAGASAFAALSFMAGCWEGEQEGIRSEECWLAPANGLMLGM